MNNIELQNKVTELNKQAKVLNAQRQQSIGKRDALNKQIADMIADYNKTYGTTLTTENIEAEFQAVANETLQKANIMEGIINAIQMGDIATANQLAGIKAEEEKVAEVSAEVVESMVEQAQAQAVVEVLVAEVPVNPAQIVSEAQVETPIQPAEVVKEAPAQAKIPSPVHNPIDISSGSVGGSLFNAEPLPTENTSSVFSRDFSKPSEEETGVPLAPPPSLGSLL